MEKDPGKSEDVPEPLVQVKEVLAISQVAPVSLSNVHCALKVGEVINSPGQKDLYEEEDDPAVVPEHFPDLDIGAIHKREPDNGDDREQEELDIEVFRAQIDTGASVSVTNLKHMLHHYRPYNRDRKSPIKLSGAVDCSDAVVPEGKGLLRIQVNPYGGYIHVPTYYSPKLTSTLVSENDILKSSIDRRHMKDYQGQSLHKLFDDETKRTGTMLLISKHKRNKQKNVVVHGVLMGGQCYTHPLIPPSQTMDKIFKVEKNAAILARHMATELSGFLKKQSNLLSEEINRIGADASLHPGLFKALKGTIPVHAIQLN